MVEGIIYIIDYLGLSNTLTIIFFIISIFVAFYLYYKTFFRLTYSTGCICKNHSEIDDWTNYRTEFITRILFFNNGRKTITHNEVHKLELSSNKINSIKIITGNEKIKTIVNFNKVYIDIDHIHSSDFFVLELTHNGQLEVEGRISETGNLLHTEPKYWLIINALFTLFFFVMAFYNLKFLTEEKQPDILKVVSNFLILFGMFGVIRFIHSILFIPDSITSKYLDKKDKFSKEFKN